MTTPMNVYKELAIQYGDIDPEDSTAVDRFFETDIYKLPEETRLTIAEVLFSHMEESSDKDETSSLEMFQYLDEDEDVPPPNPANYESLNSKRSKKAAKMADLSKKKIFKSV